MDSEEDSYDYNRGRRGCGRHYGYDNDCLMCRMKRTEYEEKIKQHHDERKRKENETKKD